MSMVCVPLCEVTARPVEVMLPAASALNVWGDGLGAGERLAEHRGPNLDRGLVPAVGREPQCLPAALGRDAEALDEQ